MRYLAHIAFIIFTSGGAALANEVGREKGLSAWDRIYAVASHPRCTNCHVGAQGTPMWAGLGLGKAPKHGMAVQADESRIGAETIPCRTCHVTSGRANTTPHAAPHILEAWRLPPVELNWLGKDSASLCAILQDPEQNDDHTLDELAEHVQQSPFVAWGFEPGAGREGAPGNVSTLARDLLVWAAAGAPCR